LITSIAEISHGQYTQYPGSTNDQYQQAGQFQQPYQYGQNQYTTQAPYTNLYPDQYGSQGIYGNQMTGPYIQESTAVTTPYTVTSPYMQVTPDCDITAQQKLASCAQQLISLGIFGASGNQLGQMTLASLKQQPSDFLIQVCNAYNRFNECVGGSRIKQACYALGPLKMRYAIADAGLDFFCGQGYNGKFGCI
uniref:Uncharacterized protein n=1 Tax=Toxocara canis TaxID=6265 RepID=A0A183UNI3_TOXCA